MARTGPVVDQILGERQAGLFEETRPADTINPVRHTLPWTRVFLVHAQDILHCFADFRPAWRIVGQSGSDHLHESRLAARIGVLAAHPDRQLGIFRVVDLHRRTGRVTGAAAHAFGFVDFQRGLAVHHRGADRRDRAARHDSRAFAYVGDQIVVDHWGLGMLHDDGAVGLSTAVDLATGGGNVHAIGHL